MRIIRNGSICAVALAIVLSVSAFAAKPKAGTYVETKGNRSVITLAVAKNRKTLTPSYYNDCSPVPVIYKAKIKKNGKFSYHGTVANVVDDKVKIKLSGKFVSKNKAKGKVQYSTAGCKGDNEKFVAKYQK